MSPKYKDPVEQGEAKEKREAQEIEALEKAVDINSLSLDDFKAASVADVRSRHPFDGYPERDVVVGEYGGKPLKIKLSHIVAYTGKIHSDPSGKRVTLGYPELRNKEGQVIRPSTERMGSIKPSMSFRAKDYESGGVDIDCVFDRTIKVAAAKGSDEMRDLEHVCFVPSPSVRAQLMFRYNSKTERIEANPDMKLADPNQIGRLRRIFEMIINPRIRLEENIRRSFDEMPDAEANRMESLPGIPEGEE